MQKHRAVTGQGGKQESGKYPRNCVCLLLGIFTQNTSVTSGPNITKRIILTLFLIWITSQLFISLLIPKFGF